MCALHGRKLSSAPVLPDTEMLTVPRASRATPSNWISNSQVIAGVLLTLSLPEQKTHPADSQDTSMPGEGKGSCPSIEKSIVSFQTEFLLGGGGEARTQFQPRESPWSCGYSWAENEQNDVKPLQAGVFRRIFFLP